ncbi:menaquinol-cytochrome c reductase cytochrome b subunit [Acidimicrobiaceae bacterium]|nr:menaquinol-cytochrome c reductase cytochrome b subunit [Acidimicrobiaceae bacterium]
MVDIPEHLLIKTAEARAKALGISVEQALAEMKGEAEPTTISKEPEVIDVKPIEVKEAPEPAAEVKEAPAPAAEVKEAPAPAAEVKEAPAPAAEVKEAPAPAAEVKETPAPAAAVKTDVPAEVEFAPETRVTQRLLTVVKAKPIQKPTSEPVDKVNTWPHLMLPEFISLMAMTAFLIFISAILQAPLLEEANPNITPNPAKAPWYFLGLQELLSYWDPQIAGVMIPLIIGVVAFMAIPYIDRNKDNKPSKRKYAIMLWTFFLAGAGTLSLIGILFRGPGWNWTYPWIDGVWFDDLLDWVHFE